MKEVVVISGKGGTGKTSLVASFAAMARGAVFADCDVDAADLHLILSPEVLRCSEFRSGHTAGIRQADRIHCGACFEHCRFDAVKMNEGEAQGANFSIDPISCEGCGVCVSGFARPRQLISLKGPAVSGLYRKPALARWCMHGLT